MTEKRLNKFKNVISRRQKYFTLVLENIHDAHNVSAIFRTAECAGIDMVYLVYNTSEFPRISKTSSASANKWIEVKRFNNVKDCFLELRKQKYKIYSTHIPENKTCISYSLYDIDYTKKIALVFGNEHSGVSDEAINFSDKNLVIPMFGMVQSLNVSVSAAICIYEGVRQRMLKGMYDKTFYTGKELNEKLKKYLSK